jgi:hypothetical protein
MIRHPNWEDRLAGYLEPLRTTPFQWGTNDCCTFAAGAVAAMTGIDPMAEFRGRYRTKRGAAIALGRIGTGTLSATMDGKLEPVPPALAQRGDVVMIDGGLGVLFGSTVILVGAAGDRDGLVLRDRADATHAWRVPMTEGAA